MFCVHGVSVVDFDLVAEPNAKTSMRSFPRQIGFVHFFLMVVHTTLARARFAVTQSQRRSASPILCPTVTTCNAYPWCTKRSLHNPLHSAFYAL